MIQKIIRSPFFHWNIGNSDGIKRHLINISKSMFYEWKQITNSYFYTLFSDIKKYKSKYEFIRKSILENSFYCSGFEISDWNICDRQEGYAG